MKLFFVCLLGILSACEAYKILVFYAVPARSHSILGDGIVRHLLNDGHEVTYVSPFKYESAPPNLRLIDVSANLQMIPKNMLNIKAITNKDVDLQDHGVMMTLMIDMVKFTIQNNNVQKIISNPNEKFDVVIAEWMFSDLPIGLATIFNCPHIWVSPVDIQWPVLRLIDQPPNPAYTGDVMYPHIAPFSFIERVTELYNQIKVQLLRYRFFDQLEKQEFENLLAPFIAKRGREVPNFYDVQFNASLVLANSHVSLGQAVAIPQNYIPIGGYHIQEKVKPLPEDLKKLLDSSVNGVIYFSMGSNLKSKDIPAAIKDNLLKMFSGLKQTVLWKFEEDLNEKPKNVHILKWAPQQSILSHPNTILFITHGGLLSTTETIHFGVPIIGIPIFADQFVNVIRAVKRGFALRVDFSDNIANELKSAIEEITTNLRYTEKAKELSFIYHHRPVTPGKELVHWVNHVIETRGAHHLRSPALNIPFYQKLYLDLLLIIMIIIFILIRILKVLLCKIFSKKKTRGGKKNN